MPKPTSLTGKKNLISHNLTALRARDGLSQQDLAQRLQLAGFDIDKNVITRIETGKRYVTDIELSALCQIFQTTFEELTREAPDTDIIP